VKTLLNSEFCILTSDIFAVIVEIDLPEH
jgi:hypothetical protein